jgi:hypothetical protein
MASIQGLSIISQSFISPAGKAATDTIPVVVQYLKTSQEALGVIPLVISLVALKINVPGYILEMEMKFLLTFF